MDDREDKKKVRGILETAGLQVEEIPEGAGKSCDFRGNDDHERYLIEVKRFDDDEAIRKARRSGDPYCRERSRFSSNTVSDQEDKAVKQLAQTARETDDDLRIGALIANRNLGADRTNILGTLYGIRKLAAQQAGKDQPWDCLYFSHSAFFRHRSKLDGVLVLEEPGVNLFLNDHSTRADRLRRSPLAAFFMQKNAFRDQASFDSKKFLVADCAGDRNDQQHVLSYLEQKYGLVRAVCINSYDYRGFLPL